MMRRSDILGFAAVAALLLACGQSSDSPRRDVCNDRAWDACVHIGSEQCGLPGSASESELMECEPFLVCENAAFDVCMGG